MQNSKNILIVEDQLLVALDLEKQLETSGYYFVNNATTYAQAIEKINDTHPDLILLDIILKNGPTGFRIAKVANEKKIPIVFITASTRRIISERLKNSSPKQF